MYLAGVSTDVEEIQKAVTLRECILSGSVQSTTLRVKKRMKKYLVIGNNFLQVIRNAFYVDF